MYLPSIITNPIVPKTIRNEAMNRNVYVRNEFIFLNYQGNTYKIDLNFPAGYLS